MKRHRILYLVPAISVILLTACFMTPAKSSISEDKANSGQSSQPDAVTLTSWQYPRFDGYEDLLARYAKAVNDKYPWITIETEMLSWDAGPEKLTVAMETGSTPDFYLDGYSRISPAVAANLGADMTDLVQEVTPYVLEGSQEDGIIDGRNYYITLWTSGAYCITVNTTLAKHLGVYEMLPADRNHWTYNDFLRISRAVRTADSSKYAIALYAGSRSSDAWYYSWILSGGTPITDKEHKAAVINTMEAATTLHVFKTIVDEGLCPTGAATMKDEDADVYFKTGQTLFSYDSPTTLSEYQELMDKGEITSFDYDVLAIPTPDGRDPEPATWGSNGFVIFKNRNDETKIDAAKKAVKEFYVNTELTLELCNGFSTAFVVKGIVPEYSTEKLAKIFDWYNAYTARYSTSSFGILEGWWSNFRETFYVDLQRLYTGSQTVEKSLSNWESSANAVILAAQSK